MSADRHQRAVDRDFAAGLAEAARDLGPGATVSDLPGETILAVADSIGCRCNWWRLAGDGSMTPHERADLHLHGQAPARGRSQARRRRAARAS